MSQSAPAILCISTYEKGQAFLRECARSGAEVSLLTEDRLRDAEWPREVLAHFQTMPGGMRLEQVIHTVAYMMRGRRVDAIVALDEFDMETAAALREHFQLPGMGTSATRLFRDKLAMRTAAARAGVRVPEFTGVFHYDALREWMERVPAPWVLKPRTQASSLGIRKARGAEDVWRALEELGDEGSHYLLERFVPGRVFHVDGIVSEGEVLLAAPHAYGRPPMQLTQSGGVFTTRALDRASALAQRLTAMHREVVKALGLKRGVTHTEFIERESGGDGAGGEGELFFLEAAARVGGAFIAEVIENSYGVNPWAEWARLEVAALRGERYTLPTLGTKYAGSVLCLARQAEPETLAYADPEVVVRVHKHHHAGLIVQSEDPARVEGLLGAYSERFLRDFCAVLPPPEKPTN